MNTLPVVQNFFGKPVRFFKAEFQVETHHHNDAFPMEKTIEENHRNGGSPLEKFTLETWSMSVRLSISTDN